MNVEIENNIVESYYHFMKNWNDKSKMDIIGKLQNSLDNENKITKDLSIFFGSWNDDKPADEIISEIMNDRKNFQQIEEL